MCRAYASTTPRVGVDNLNVLDFAAAGARRINETTHEGFPLSRIQHLPSWSARATDGHMHE